MAKRDFYEVLGAGRSASADELKKAYRKKVKELHPDRNADNPDADAQMKEVNEAYDILKDAEKKAAYDRFGHSAFEGGGPGPGAGGGRGDFSGAFSDVFDDLFGEFMGGRGGRSRPRKGGDLRYNLTISLEEAFAGVKKNITIPTASSCGECSGTGSAGGSEPQRCPTCSGMGKVRAQQGFFTIERACPTCSGNGQIIKNPCSNCHGEGRVQQEKTLSVNIPKGVEAGMRVRLAGEGEAGLRGSAPGDLFIFVDISRHKIFERDGGNLFCRVPVSMSSAALGGDIEVPNIDGGRSRVKVPSGSQTGRQMRLRGKGMPSVRDKSYGDMFIELVVETPVNLTSKQKELLREFEALSQDNNPASSTFFDTVKSFWDNMKT